MATWEDSEVPEWVAREVAEIGIAARLSPETVGECFVVAGQRFAVVATVTRDEFIAAANEKFPGRNWTSAPHDVYFYKVSTD